MGVVDGQPVSAAITNPAFIDANADDQGFGKYDFVNTDPLSGEFVFNLQQNINNQIQNHKLFLSCVTNEKLYWTAPLLTFPQNIVINFEDFSITNTILSSNSPITLADGQSLYVTLNRTSNATLTPSINSVLPKGKDTLRIATRLGNDLFLYDNTLIRSGKSAAFGEVAPSPLVKSDFLDPVSTTLPTGSSYVADGIAIVDNQTVLFTNLSSGNSQIYKVTGVGVSLVWTAQNVFDNGASPLVGDIVRVKSGNSFATQLAVYDGSLFKVNNTVRLFQGADYWELGSLQTTALLDNTTDNVFTVNYSQSENMIIHLSVLRGTFKETATLHVTTDGTTVVVSEIGSYLSDVGVSFTGDISSTLLRLRYTTTSTGTDATMKYFLLRWADGSGGPGGPPSYGAGGVAPFTAAGSNTQIQYNDSTLFGADLNFTWDKTFRILTVGSVQYVGLNSVTLSDNVLSPTNAFTISATSFPFAIVEYSIVRNTTSEMGTLMVITDGTSVNISSEINPLSPTGITFSATVSAGVTNIQYTSTNTGFNGTLKYSMRRWS